MRNKLNIRYHSFERCFFAREIVVICALRYIGYCDYIIYAGILISLLYKKAVCDIQQFPSASFTLSAVHGCPPLVFDRQSILLL